MKFRKPKLSDFQKAKVLVVGDVMLDRYWFGDVNRISPEAPVPVAKIGKIEHRAGGAANVARNIAALGGQVSLLSVVGNDEAAGTLADLLKQDNIGDYMHRSSHAPTTLKLRILSKNQQLLRADFEEKPDSGSLNSVYQMYGKLVGQFDAVILSDYGKGVLNEVQVLIASARAIGKPVLIDPKGTDFSKYEGATLLTPNRAELREAAGGWSSEQGLTDKAQKLCHDLDLDALLVTRSEEGMSLYQDDEVFHQETRAQEVFDVSGAGDTVIAAMGLCLAAKYDMPSAMHIANSAAGVVVAKLGTATCSFEELETTLKK
ncbi:D-glycero-beta-D-manno-heptose-7-phosphate kinase [Alysiella crassa]|nr:D-glycero-beta-D-manno-heptose-7-phosphate kinase [Alysiella crassa]UOP08173.1 D-glycero-beta-D-manno-heptose-7-phosphate kinase [Alysiella crassa]